MENKIDFNSVEEIIDEMIVMFGADIEDVTDGALSDLGAEEMKGVYELMVIAYELGLEEA